MNSSFIENLNNKLNMIELTSKPIVENDAAWQQHGTPNEVIDMMLEMYYKNGEFKNNERILILFNVEFIKQIYFKYRDELIFGNLYFIADSQEKFDIVKRLYPNVHCVLCDQHNIENLIKKIGEFNVKKFDIVFSNPPYNDNLDLKILEKLFPVAKNIVFIHPSIFILDKRFVKDLYNRIRNTNYLSELTLFWGNRLFNIGLFTPLCISCWDISKTNNNVEVNDLAFSNTTYNCKINEVSINYGSLLPLKKDFDIFFNNIKQYQRAYDKRVKPDYSDMTDFSIKLATIRGHIGLDCIADDFFSYCSMDLKNNFVDSTWRAKRKNDGERLCWSFSTEKDRLNFAKYLNTKIVRFISSLIKISQNYDMTYVPWLDFTQEWNDAKLCKEFGISEELWNYIDKFIPDYYDDYKSGF